MHRSQGLSKECYLLATIIYRRIENKVEEILADDQFGLRRNKETREATLALRS